MTPAMAVDDRRGAAAVSHNCKIEPIAMLHD